MARPLTHEGLDAACEDGKYVPSIEHLRSLLVATSVLPPRDNHLARLRPRLARLIAGVPGPDRRAVQQQYARWRLLPPIEEASRRGLHTASRCYGAYARLRVVATFLTWLAEQQLALSACTQAVIEAWITQHSRADLKVLRSYLLWAQKYGHGPAPALGTELSNGFTYRVSEDERWAAARNAIHDESWSISDRAAALLVLLYAQTPSRIASLTKDQVVTDAASGVTSILLGEDPISHLVPPLEELIRRLPEPHRNGAGAAVRLDDRWLVPGNHPGHHVDPTTLMRRLKLHGVRPQAQRNTTLLHLAQQVPTAVLADLLGLHPATVERWRRHAGGNWARYASGGPTCILGATDARFASNEPSAK